MSRSSNKYGITLKSHMPVIQKVPFSNGSWNKIGVSRKALLSTTAKYSILQSNFQLYSPEYRHLPHQLDQDAISYSVPSLQPTHAASEALMHSSHMCSAVSGNEVLVLFSSSWILKLLTSLTIRLVQRKLYPEVCNLTKLTESCEIILLFAHNTQ